MIEMLRAELQDAQKLLEVQRESFAIYAERYGDFESNPYYMDLHRMKFNINYRFGQYYKLIDKDTEEIIGGLFCFELDEKETMKIAQFYFLEPYQHLGYGSDVLKKLFTIHPQVKKWYVDTIMQEEYNVEFYKHLGFEIIDEEEEHEGLTFVTFLKKVK